MAPWVAEIKAQGEEGKTAKGMIDKSNVVVDERGGWGSNGEREVWRLDDGLDTQA